MSDQKIKIHSVKYNLIMNVILKMSSFVFPLITFPYVSRILGAEGNGKVAFASSVIYYFSVIASLGIPTYGVRICAKYREDVEKLSKTVKELLIISSIMMIVSYILFFVALTFIPRLQEEKPLMLINSVTILLTVTGVEWFYQAIEQYDYITFRNLVFKILSIVLMFLFVHKSEDYIKYGLICVVGTSGSNILNFFRLNKFVKLNNKYPLEFRTHLKPIMMLFLLTASTIIYTSLDTTMLGFISGDSEVGYYNAAVKLKGILVSVVTALGTVLLPRLSYYLTNGMKKEFIALIRKSFNFVLLISIPLSVFCIVQAADCILFLAGDGYSKSILPMQFITPSIIFIGITNIIGIQILVPVGEEKKTVISTIAGAIVNLILNSILIPLFGAAGAALATMIAEFSVLVVQIYMIKGSILEMINFKNCGKIVVANVFALSVLTILNIFITVESLFVKLLILAVVYFVVYGSILILLREDIIMEIIGKVFNRTRNGAAPK